MWSRGVWLALLQSCGMNAAMEVSLKSQMIARWRVMADQCRETLAFWRENNFRVVVKGIDITDAEQAATEARIAHLARLIAAVESSDQTSVN